MIYLDHASTTPVLPEVKAAMLPWLGVPANPSSIHAHGRAALEAVERARAEVALLLGRDPAGIVFTSGATEANHLALRGWAAKGAHTFAVAGLEHPSVHGALEQAGVERIAMDVGPDGLVRIDVADGTDVVVLQAVNHETGVAQPIGDALAAARRVGAVLHIDAAQACGKTPLDLGDADSVVVSAHKLGGPVGMGAVSLRDGIGFPPLLTGGAQERGRRAGTINVAGVVGFAEACRLAVAELASRRETWISLAHRLRPGLVALGGRVLGSPIPSTTCVVFEGVAGELVVQALDLEGISVSSGAACASGSTEPSPVLAAMHEPDPRGGVRFSFGPRTTSHEIDAVIAALRRVLPRVKAASSLERSDAL